MIVNAVRIGFMEGDGPYYKQPRIEIRPRPQHSFNGRIYAVASSEESVASAARLGAHTVMFADRPWEMRLPVIERGRALHGQLCQRCHMLRDAASSEVEFLHPVGPTGGASSAVSPCRRLFVEPAPVRKATEEGEMWSATTLAFSSGAREADVVA